MGGGGVEDGISHPLLIAASSLSGSHPHAQLFPFLHQGESTAGGSSVASREGSYRTCSSVSELLQPSLCCVEDLRVVEACHRPLAPEPSRHPNMVQDGDQPVGPPCHSEGRLDGLHRSAGRLPSDPCSFRFSPVSSFRGVRGVVPIQGALFRSLHGSACLIIGHGSNFRDA